MCRHLNCCGCVSLETGCQIIGSLYLFGAIITFISICVSAIWVALPFTLISIMTHTLLLVGSSKKMSTPILIYLVFEMINLVLLGILLLVTVVVLIAVNDHLWLTNFGLSGISSVGIAFLIVFCFVMYGLQVYFWSVVYSHFNELKEAERAHSRLTNQSEMDPGRAFHTDMSNTLSPPAYKI